MNLKFVMISNFVSSSNISIECFTSLLASSNLLKLNQISAFLRANSIQRLWRSVPFSNVKFASFSSSPLAFALRLHRAHTCTHTGNPFPFNHFQTDKSKNLPLIPIRITEKKPSSFIVVIFLGYICILTNCFQDSAEKNQLTSDRNFKQLFQNNG